MESRRTGSEVLHIYTLVNNEGPGTLAGSLRSLGPPPEPGRAISLSPIAMRLALAVAVLFLSACESPDSPRLDNAADSLAFGITEGAGGLRAFQSLPGLQWEWAVVQDSSERMRTRHVWDQRGDRARVEWPVGGDSVLVAVYNPSTFDPDAPTGTASLNGQTLTGTELAERLTEANQRFINDGYWLLAPLKVLDEGVSRQVDTESGFDRLALSFDGVGLTPGDRYWIEVEPVTGSMTGWSYALESGNEGRWEWTDPVELVTPDGPLVLSRVKVSDDGRTVITTDPVALAEIDETEFTDMTPRLRILGG